MMGDRAARDVIARAWFERNMASLDLWDSDAWREERAESFGDADVILAALETAGFVVVDRGRFERLRRCAMAYQGEADTIAQLMGKRGFSIGLNPGDLDPMGGDDDGE